MSTTRPESSKFSVPASAPLDPDFRFSRSLYTYQSSYSNNQRASSTSHLISPASLSTTSLDKELPEPPAVLTPLRSAAVYEWANRPREEDVPPLPPFSFANVNNPPSRLLPPPIPEDIPSQSPSRFSFHPRGSHARTHDFDNDSRNKRHVSWSLVFPALLVFMVAVGLASLLLAYVLVLRSVKKDDRIRLNEMYGVAFYVSEGEGADKMLGLLISSATTHIIALTSSVLVSAYAYCIASLWLTAQANKQSPHQRGVSVPTPYQYGTLMALMSAPSLKNLFRAARYLSRGSARPRIPSFFTIAFGGVASVILNSLLIGFADVWLHATASVLHTEVSAAPSPESSSPPETIVPTQITRYPLASLLTYAFLVYAYGLLSLIIYLFALTSSSPTLRSGSGPTALELAHIQLSDPLSLVANLWPSPKGTFTARRVEDLFPEDDTTLRLEVGLDQTSGHVPDFRVYRRIGVPWKAS